MILRPFLFFLLLVVVVVHCGPVQQKRPASGFSVTWELMTNVPSGSSGLRAQFEIKNAGTETIAGDGWTLFFNFPRVIDPASVTGDAVITHINGDFYSLSPTDEFGSLNPGDSKIIEYSAGAWVIKECEAPDGLYLVFNDSQDPQQGIHYTIKPFERPVQLQRTAGDVVPVPSAASRFEANRNLTRLPEGELPLLIPSPVEFKAVDGEAKISPDSRIIFGKELENEGRHLVETLNVLSGLDYEILSSGDPGPGDISLLTGDISIAGRKQERGSEAYELEIRPDGPIQITGSDPAGVFYGIQSLRALIHPLDYSGSSTTFVLPAARVSDFPLFHYRGMHLDVARNFHSKESVLKLLDLMSFYKLNRFHFHLTDDEGWRLAINEFPELTQVGSRRGHTLDETEHLVPSFGSGPDPDDSSSHGNGYYSRDDFIEILKYATRRHIEVIPEIDLPGHARAAIKSMESRFRRLSAEGRQDEALRFRLNDPQDQSTYQSVQGWNDNVVNVCRDSTYRFIEAVVDDVSEMYEEARAPLKSIHTGGDEVPAGVWAGSPLCNERISSGELEGVTTTADLPGYFLRRVNSILKSRNLILAGWEEVALTPGPHGSPKSPSPEFVQEGFRPYVWNSVWGWGGEQNAYGLANIGYEVVLCNVTNLYFDLSYNKDPKEPGYYWGGFVDTRQPWEFVPFDIYQGATRDIMGKSMDPAVTANFEALTEAGKNGIIGMQAQLWSENARGPELLEYLVFPKMLSFAERAWALEPSWAKVKNPERRASLREASWNTFANMIGQRELPRLDRMNGELHYRIPLPGAEIRDGKLLANVEFPGLILRYTVDGSDPTADSLEYTEPVEVETAKIRTFNSVGRGSRTVTLE